MRKGSYQIKYRDRHASRTVRWERFVVILLILSGIALGLFYLYHQQSDSFKQNVFAKLNEMKAWVFSHKQKRSPMITTASSGTGENDADSIHFDFYTTLPSMRVETANPSEPLKTASSAPSTTPSTAPQANKKMVVTKPSTSKPFFNSSEELEKEFASKLIKSPLSKTKMVKKT